MGKNKTVITELQVNIKNALAAVNELESEIREIGLKGHLEKGLLQQIQRVRNKGTGLLGNMITMSDTSADMAKLMTEFEHLRGSIGLLNNDFETLIKTKIKFLNLDLKGDDVEKYHKKVAAATKAQEKLIEVQKTSKVKGAASAELKDKKVRIADMGVEDPKKTRDQLTSAMAKQARATAGIDTEGKSTKELNQELNAVDIVLREIKEQREQNLQTIYEENKVTEEQVSNYRKLLAYAKDFQDGQKGEKAGKARRGFTNTAKKLGADFSDGNSDEKKLDFLSQLTASNQKLVEVASLVTEADKSFEEFRTTVQEATGRISENLQQVKKDYTDAQEVQNKFEAEKVEEAGDKAKAASGKITGLENSLDDLKTQASGAADSLGRIEKTEGFFSRIQQHISAVFDLASIFQYLQQAVRSATQTISELDAAFTEIAVVTDMTSEELWQSFDTYNDMAQQLGTTTKDAIETSALYYQQGLETAEVMELTAETMKMARIAGMDYAEATDRMTGTLRAFKLEMEDAQRVNDVFSALAAESASDTDELSQALSKTASIAQSAGMELETTTALLAQMVETTREAPENLGTAMKTVIARFQELKKDVGDGIEVDGELVEVNKVETALNSVGVALRDKVTGQFRDLDDVFLELSSKWDSLDRNTQRYVATIAAGSRQQSRFIAMMDNYERTIELVDVANSAAGASQKQFEKTLDSVEAKVNQLKASWEDLIGTLVNNEFVKGLLDGLNTVMGMINHIANMGIPALATLGPLLVMNGMKFVKLVLSGTKLIGQSIEAGLAGTKFQGYVDQMKKGNTQIVDDLSKQLKEKIAKKSGKTMIDLGTTGAKEGIGKSFTGFTDKQKNAIANLNVEDKDSIKAAQSAAKEAGLVSKDSGFFDKKLSIPELLELKNKLSDTEQVISANSEIIEANSESVNKNSEAVERDTKEENQKINLEGTSLGTTNGNKTVAFSKEQQNSIMAFDPNNPETLVPAFAAAQEGGVEFSEGSNIEDELIVLKGAIETNTAAVQSNTVAENNSTTQKQNEENLDDIVLNEAEDKTGKGGIKGFFEKANSSTAGKIGGLAAQAVGSLVGGAITAGAMKEDSAGKEEAAMGQAVGNAAGSAIGMALGGPLGAAIGGAIGEIGGAALGKLYGEWQDNREYGEYSLKEVNAAKKEQELVHARYDKEIEENATELDILKDYKELANTTNKTNAEIEHMQELYFSLPEETQKLVGYNTEITSLTELQNQQLDAQIQKLYEEQAAYKAIVGMADYNATEKTLGRDQIDKRKQMIEDINWDGWDWGSGHDSDAKEMLDELNEKAMAGEITVDSKEVQDAIKTFESWGWKDAKAEVEGFVQTAVNFAEDKAEGINNGIKESIVDTTNAITTNLDADSYAKEKKTLIGDILGKIGQSGNVVDSEEVNKIIEEVGDQENYKELTEAWSTTRTDAGEDLVAFFDGMNEEEQEKWDKAIAAIGLTKEGNYTELEKLVKQDGSEGAKLLLEYYKIDENKEALRSTFSELNEVQQKEIDKLVRKGQSDIALAYAAISSKIEDPIAQKTLAENFSSLLNLEDITPEIEDEINKILLSTDWGSAESIAASKDNLKKYLSTEKDVEGGAEAIDAIFDNLGYDFYKNLTHGESTSEKIAENSKEAADSISSMVALISGTDMATFGNKLTEWAKGIEDPVLSLSLGAEIFNSDNMLFDDEGNVSLANALETQFYSDWMEGFDSEIKLNLSQYTSDMNTLAQASERYAKGIADSNELDTAKNNLLDTQNKLWNSIYNKSLADYKTRLAAWEEDKEGYEKQKEAIEKQKEGLETEIEELETLQERLETFRDYLYEMERYENILKRLEGYEGIGSTIDAQIAQSVALGEVDAEGGYEGLTNLYGEKGTNLARDAVYKQAYSQKVTEDLGDLRENILTGDMYAEEREYLSFDDTTGAIQIDQNKYTALKARLMGLDPEKDAVAYKTTEELLKNIDDTYDEYTELWEEDSNARVESIEAVTAAAEWDLEKTQQIADFQEKVNNQVVENLNKQKDKEIEAIEEVIEKRQEELEEKQKLYDKMKDADNDYIDSLNKAYDKMKKDRDAEDLDSEIAQLEQKLAMMKRDTSGVYALEIKETEEELNELRQQKSDASIESFIEQEQEGIDKKHSGYDKELEAMQEAIDVAEEVKEKVSEKWDEMLEEEEETHALGQQKFNELMQGGTTALQTWMSESTEGFKGMSRQQRTVFETEWKTGFATANAALHGWATNSTTQSATSSAAIAAAKAEVDKIVLSYQTWNNYLETNDTEIKENIPELGILIEKLAALGDELEGIDKILDDWEKNKPKFEMQFDQATLDQISEVEASLSKIDTLMNKGSYVEDVKSKGEAFDSARSKYYRAVYEHGATSDEATKAREVAEAALTEYTTSIQSAANNGIGLDTLKSTVVELDDVNDWTLDDFKNANKITTQGQTSLGGTQAKAENTHIFGLPVHQGDRVDAAGFYYFSRSGELKFYNSPVTGYVDGTAAKEVDGTRLIDFKNLNNDGLQNTENDEDIFYIRAFGLTKQEILCNLNKGWAKDNGYKNLQIEDNVVKFDRPINAGIRDSGYNYTTKYTHSSINLTEDLLGTSDDRQDNYFYFSSIGYQRKYATGGYVDFTGPAWVDGTKSKPEAFLSASDTARFESLRDTLASIYSPSKYGINGMSNETKNYGDQNFEIHINVEKASSEADIQKLAKRLEKELMKTATKNNVLAVNRR